MRSTLFKMLLVGEAWGREEEEKGEPFVGASGHILNGILRTVGIPRNEIYLTNVFNRRPSQTSNDLAALCGPKADALPGYPSLSSSKYVRAEFKPELDRLYAEIARERPNVIVAAGATPAWALLQVAGIRKLRGAPITVSRMVAERVGYNAKVLGTYHPSAVMREWKLRPIVIADMDKAKREAEFPEIRRPAREFWIEPSIDDLHMFEARFITPGCDLSIDIETAGGQITNIGFAPSPQVALNVPFINMMQRDGNYWRTRNEEREAWKFVRRLCATHPGIFQNGLYDMNYLWRVYGIICQPKDDTMLLHHALQPEMEKGLGFLGSVYTDEPAWKFMRKRGDDATLKNEDE